MIELDDMGVPRLKQGGPLKLAPKERAVLAQLLRRPDGVVSKAAFAQEAWQGEEMTDESLARSISRLRRVLKPLGTTLEAHYGLGYRLVLEAPSAPQDLETLAHARQLLVQRTPAAVTRCIELARELCARSAGLLEARIVLVEALVVAILWGQLPTAAGVAEGMALLADFSEGRKDFPGFHATRASLLDLAWRFDEADEQFTLALRSEERVDTLMAYSRHLLCMDRCAEAVDVLRRVRQLAPHLLHARMNLARALVQGGAGSEAVAEVRAAQVDHPGTPVLQAFALAIEAMVAPRKELEAAAQRMTDGADAQPFAWSVLAFVRSRLGLREATLDIVDAMLLCSATDAGERSLYAAPLAAIGETARATALLEAAAEQGCGILGLVLRDPAHAHWLPADPAGQRLLKRVFG